MNLLYRAGEVGDRGMCADRPSRPVKYLHQFTASSAKHA
jgi:hypothetical protein